MKILITGAAGYIGSTLLDMLSQNASYEITAIDNFTHNNQYAVQPFMGRPNVKVLKQDIEEVDLNHNVIVHLAALVGASYCDKNPSEAKRVNYEAVKRLAQSEAKIIFTNTNSGYGLGGEDKCTEESPLKPLSLYGQTKCDAEKLLLDRGNAASLRLATVFGVSPRMRMDLMVNDFVYKLYFENGIEMYEPNARRNFVGVRDVARAIMWAFDLEGIYNVGLDEANCTKLELANRLKDIINPLAAIKPIEGEDPDKRDYIVSSEKLMSTGFSFKEKLTSTLKVKELCRIYGQRIKEFRNY